MKIEIEKSEYDRLKSREEKLMAYYEWFVDKENDLVTVEDIINKNIEIREENKMLHKEQGRLHRLWSKDTKHIAELEEENKKLKYVIDILMEKTGIENIKLATGEVFLNPKKRLKLNTDFIEEDTLQELRDLGKI